uniref:Methyltransferase n=1 Tax=Ganoderma boninense TaxID=34458 RepID=A0A5K1JXN9_9APHY|nr:Uncharacterized protein [Ganoderma boninense]
MAATAVLTPRDVATTHNYYKALDNDPPRRYVRVEPPEGKPDTNVGLDPRPALVHDVRGREADFSLDKNGFQYLRWPSVEKDFADDEVIKDKYYPEVEQILKEATGAKRVYIFDHTVRLRRARQVPLPRRGRAPPAVARTHHQRLAADPNPVAHAPLALGDWRTLDPADLVSIDLVYPDRHGTTYSVNYNGDSEIRWYFLGGQTPDEVTLIKCFDSETGETARLTPHTAFRDAGSPRDAPHRQSIEVRALVFDAE